jgi:DDE superfamily endonuclease
VAADQKGARAESAWVVVFDESGISLIPPVRRTWARRGRTPLLPHRCHWKRASMAAALGYHPDGTKARLCFPLQADSYDTDSLIEVLDQLKGFYAAHKVVLLWDGLSAHWSHKMRAHLDQQRAWLTVERLPAYAPELNPVEFLWATSRAPSWPTSPVTPWPRSPTKPTMASSECATATAWSSGSWPIPASAWTMNHHPKAKGSIRTHPFAPLTVTRDLGNAGPHSA